MKRYTALFVILLLAFVLNGVAYGEAKVVVKSILTITVNSAQLRTDVPPINVQGQTLVPVRSIFYAFGADVQWFPTEKKVFIRRGTEVIWLRIGQAQAQVNDTAVPLDVAARIYRGRTMVPLRFIAEALGSVVNWDPTTQTITITTHQSLTPGQPPPSLPNQTTTPPAQTVTPPNQTEQPSTPSPSGQ